MARTSKTTENEGRPSIPVDLSARVLLAADRTCCICRDERESITLHHIDENPRNNTFENLAAVCPNCHSKIHTKPGFARMYLPEYVDLANRQWRESVQRKRGPDRRFLDDLVYLAADEILAACHAWKFAYIRASGSTPVGSGRYADVWESFSRDVPHSYSPATFQSLCPAFTSALNELNSRMDRVALRCGDQLPIELRVTMLRTTTTLRGEAERFWVVGFLGEEVGKSIDRTLHEAISNTARAIGALAKLSESLRDAHRT